MAAPEKIESSREPGIADSINLVWEWSQQGKKPERIGRDGFPMYANDPLAATHKALDEYLIQNSNRGAMGIIFNRIYPQDSEAGVAFLKLPDEKKVVVLRAIV